MTEQVVDFLETVKVEAKHGEPPPTDQSRFDLVIEPLVEAAAVRKFSKGVVMSQESNFLLGLFTSPQIADRNRVMRLPGEVYGMQNQFDRCFGAVGQAQLGFDRLGGLPEESQSGNLVGKVSIKLCADHLFDVGTREGRKAVVDGDDGFAFANEKPLHGGVGKAAHPIGFHLRTPAIPDIKRYARNARRMMPKLASATAIASQLAGTADLDTSIAGSGMIETAPIAVKWWLHIATVRSSAP